MSMHSQDANPAAELRVFVHNAIEPAGMARLRALPGVRVAVIDNNDEPQHWLLPDDELARTEILLSTFMPANLDRARSLKLVQISSAGFEHLDGPALVDRGIRVCNAAGVYDVPIAEWNIAMMFALVRDMRGMIRHQEHGIWDRHERFQRELYGLTVGFWGYGGLARATARLCKLMGMRVHVLVRERPIKKRPDFYCVAGHGDPDGVLPDEVFATEQKERFLGGLNFLVIAMPLSPQTRRIVREEDLGLLPSDAYVLNPCRGPIIDEQALLNALRQGRIAGAALDAHYHYPMPADHPLWRFPNVIMTPHVSGSNHSPYFRPRLWEIFVENVQRYSLSSGGGPGPFLNEIDPRELRGALGHPSH